MPANVKRDLGLDRERSWIVTTEVNRFVWPGPDVRPLGGGDPFYGAIPDWLFMQVREAIGGRAEHGWLRLRRGLSSELGIVSPEYDASLKLLNY